MLGKTLPHSGPKTPLEHTSRGMANSAESCGHSGLSEVGKVFTSFFLFLFLN